jgi:hypothetical protein
LRRRLSLGLLLILFGCTASVPSGEPSGQRAPILDFPPAFSEAQFGRSCVESRGYGAAQCQCALREVRQRFRGKDREIGLLYLQLTLIAEHDVEAITAWLGPGVGGACPPRPATPVPAEISRLHVAPSYLYGALKLIAVAPDRFKEWEHRDEILTVRSRCLPPPASIVRQARRIETCIEDSLQVGHCSRCHDYRGVDLLE